jgi:hypothetical protein
MNYNFDIASYMTNGFLGISPWIIVFLAAWTLIWMGIALWKAAKREHIVWFIIFLLVHTLGILEILYIFIFSNIGYKSKLAPRPAARARRRR